MTKTQNELLKMMKQFHDVCRKNNIKYYMLGGTLIGAIRHKGFIPWDDDIDLGIPREDYNILLKKYKEILPQNLEIITAKNDKEHPLIFAKLYNKNTTVVEDVFAERIGGLYIDIFPIDGAPKNIKRIKKHYFKVKLYSDFFRYSRAPKNSQKSYKRFIQMVSKIIGEDYWYNKTEKLLNKYEFDESKYVGNLLGAYKIKEIVPKSYFGSPTLYEFEDTEFYGLENYHEYLTSIYGDYMKLPPIEKQVSHHNVKYINFELPYLEYKKMHKINKDM